MAEWNGVRMIPNPLTLINRDLVRCVRVLQVSSSIPVSIKVDKAAVDSTTTGDESCMAWSQDNSFFEFLRVGEIVAPPGSGFDPSIHLLVGEVSVDSCSTPTYLAVKYKSFEPFRQGVTVYLGRTHNRICPVAASYVKLLGSERYLKRSPIHFWRWNTP